MNFPPGTQFGDYLIRDRIGRGGMAYVYRAVHQPLEREVALKVMSPELGAGSEFLQRFANEARTLGQLDHPNIVPVYDYGTGQGLSYLTMPFIRGGSLRDRIGEGRPTEIGMAWRVIHDISKALAHAHSAGIVHRDVKPGNVLLHPDGRALLVDFGLSRSLHRPTGLTLVGISIGTLGYMSPEQALGVQVDHRSDIYAVGVLVFELLTGTMPYDGPGWSSVVLATLRAPIPSARERNPVLPPELDEVLKRALAKDPAERPGTADELLEMLRKVPMNRPRTAA